MRRLATSLLLTAAGIATAPPATAQSVLERPPNLTGTWTGRPGSLQFNFLHRFSAGDAPSRKVTSSPTFLLALPIGGGLLPAVRYATNSTLGGIPNEWEALVRWSPLREAAGSPLDAALNLAWNWSARSPDGSLSVARTFGPVRLIAEGRVLGRAFDTDTVRFGAGAGAVVRVLPWLALAGDVFTLLDTPEDEEDELVWGAGAQIAIPTTPHTLSLQATTANTSTLHGSARGTDQIRWGFEFTIPVTFARWFGGARPVAPPPTASAGGVTEAVIEGLAFPDTIRIAAGETVEWINRDPLIHTVTAADGSWDSGEIAPDGRWRRTFHRPGTYAYTCTPHPTMQGVIVVEAR